MSLEDILYTKHQYRGPIVRYYCILARLPIEDWWIRLTFDFDFNSLEYMRVRVTPASRSLHFFTEIE